jgi:hypothetical protein
MPRTHDFVARRRLSRFGSLENIEAQLAYFTPRRVVAVGASWSPAKT